MLGIFVTRKIEANLAMLIIIHIIFNLVQKKLKKCKH